MTTLESRQAAKAVICELLATAGGTLKGRVRLNKAFYFAHLYYWRDALGVLTDYPIVRMPLGPGIDDGPSLVAELVQEERIIVSTAPIGPYQEYVYTLCRDIELDPKSSRTMALRAAIELVESRTGAELSELTHEYSRSWQATPDGREMDIYADLMSDEELEAARAEVQKVRQLAERD